ncbi:hypothetical protein SARC_12596 [Sphaeroforma arctica JP610]|uniref:Polysaccharide pyruvyl transferase domain-containing protein n=1 Tax=Sphaeroforma arctica JP610 TaxID=667725 RepID=A0A0L0FDL9_9EUKA|nr:hypothetical protein SARC_12596 [Sphaeroforma arctica JP610]KNC74864.1 hypothetical protein SARC_12596 [Sphaeroforma arctica JP610]|eukprot:XP_014148766.1 hypothetical protein SARC_12596 [Sphaeroforma arctica JP610]
MQLFPLRRGPLACITLVGLVTLYTTGIIELRSYDFTKRPVVFIRAFYNESLVSAVSYSMHEMEKYAGTGNSGNHVWSYGASSLVDTDQNVILSHTESPFTLTHPSSEVEINLVMIPVANNLPCQKSIAQKEKFIINYQYRNTKTAVIGIGCDYFPVSSTSEIDMGSNATLLDPTNYIALQNLTHLRRLKDSIDQLYFFSVRGRVTEMVLEHFDIASTNLGCPSLMISSNRRLGNVLAEKMRIIVEGKNTSELRFIITLPWKFLKETLKLLLNISEQYPGSAVVLQDRRDIATLRTAESNGLKVPWERVFFFFSVTRWREFAREFDGVIGSRIHGTMVPLSVGVPGLILALDQRLKELAERMHIPVVPVFDTRITANNTVVDIFKLALSIFNADAFDKNRQQTARVYRKMLLGAGVFPSKNLLRLC